MNNEYNSDSNETKSITDNLIHIIGNYYYEIDKNQYFVLSYVDTTDEAKETLGYYLDLNGVIKGVVKDRSSRMAKRKHISDIKEHLEIIRQMNREITDYLSLGVEKEMIDWS